MFPLSKTQGNYHLLKSVQDLRTKEPMKDFRDFSEKQLTDFCMKCARFLMSD